MNDSSSEYSSDEGFPEPLNYTCIHIQQNIPCEDPYNCSRRIQLPSTSQRVPAWSHNRPHEAHAQTWHTAESISAQISTQSYGEPSAQASAQASGQASAQEVDIFLPSSSMAEGFYDPNILIWEDDIETDPNEIVIGEEIPWDECMDLDIGPLQKLTEEQIRQMSEEVVEENINIPIYTRPLPSKQTLDPEDDKYFPQDSDLLYGDDRPKRNDNLQQGINFLRSPEAYKKMSLGFGVFTEFVIENLLSFSPIGNLRCEHVRISPELLSEFCLSTFLEDRRINWPNGSREATDAASTTSGSQGSDACVHQFKGIACPNPGRCTTVTRLLERLPGLEIQDLDPSIILDLTSLASLQPRRRPLLDVVHELVIILALDSRNPERVDGLQLHCHHNVSLLLLRTLHGELTGVGPFGPPAKRRKKKPVATSRTRVLQKKQYEIYQNLMAPDEEEEHLHPEPVVPEPKMPALDSLLGVLLDHLSSTVAHQPPEIFETPCQHPMGNHKLVDKLVNKAQDYLRKFRSSSAADETVPLPTEASIPDQSLYCGPLFAEGYHYNPRMTPADAHEQMFKVPEVDLTQAVQQAEQAKAMDKLESLSLKEIINELLLFFSEPTKEMVMPTCFHRSGYTILEKMLSRLESEPSDNSSSTRARPAKDNLASSQQSDVNVGASTSRARAEEPQPERPYSPTAQELWEYEEDRRTIELNTVYLPEDKSRTKPTLRTCHRHLFPLVYKGVPLKSHYLVLSPGWSCVFKKYPESNVPSIGFLRQFSHVTESHMLLPNEQIFTVAEIHPQLWYRFLKKDFTPITSTTTIPREDQRKRGLKASGNEAKNSPLARFWNDRLWFHIGLVDDNISKGFFYFTDKYDIYKVILPNSRIQDETLRSLKHTRPMIVEWENYVRHDPIDENTLYLKFEFFSTRNAPHQRTRPARIFKSGTCKYSIAVRKESPQKESRKHFLDANKKF